MATAMPYLEVMQWFEQNDPTKTRTVSRALVESLLNILLGTGFSSGNTEWLDSICDSVTSKANYDQFMQKVFGEFSMEGVRWRDTAWLGGADPTQFLVCDCPDIGKGEPAMGGDSNFEALVNAAPGAKPQTVNRIKKCDKCSKVNAYTMTTCNGCGADISGVEESTTPNLFVGMIFGVAKAPFPLKISLRTETPDTMVFDDPLALTRAHVLAVPTEAYVPDIRSLFTAPEKGLALIQRLEKAAWEALEAGPLSSKEWRQKALSAKAAAEDVPELRKHVLAAFNMPPSQYQLHLQYMLPPLTPKDFALWKKGVHFCKGRHFPYIYVVKSLEAFISTKTTIEDASSLTADQLIGEIKSKVNVDYEKDYKDDQDKLGKSNLYLANWQEADFSCVVGGDTVTDRNGNPLTETKTPKDVETADKLALQGYGRPYGQDGKPGGVYYSHAKRPEVLPEFNS